MKFLIFNGNAYLIDGKVAKKVIFSIDGEMQISNEENDIIEVNGSKYTYDEVMRKLNIRYMVAQAKVQVETEPEKIVDEKNKEEKDDRENNKNKKADKKAE